MKNPTIKKVANGYWVYEERQDRCISNEEVFVFESLSSLVAFLTDLFTKGESKSTMA